MSVQMKRQKKSDNMDSIQVLEYYGLIDEGTNISYDLQVKISCPFHAENIESLNFDLKNNIYFCFGCGAKGDIVKFVEEIENINRLQAMLKVKRISEGSEEVKKEIEDMVRERTKNRKELRAKAKAFYKNLSSSADNNSIHYLKERGLTLKTIKKFNVKYSTHSQYTVMIPLFDAQQFKGYIQRRIDEGQPKYLYNKGFQKTKTLVGKVKNDYPLLIVEGIFDIMKAWQFGYKNVVCILGWKVSPYQLKRIKEANIIISALDNDRAGKEGNKFLKDQLKEAGDKEAGDKEAGGKEVYDFKYNVIDREIKDIGDLNKSEFRKIIEIVLQNVNKK